MTQFITTREGEELTGFTKEHIARLVRAGKVVGKRFGQAWQVDKESLLEYTKQAQRNNDGRYGPRK